MIFTHAAGIARRCLWRGSAAILLVGSAPGTGAQTNPADDPFEAALRTMPSARPPVQPRAQRGGGVRSAARSGGERRDKVAPAGAIPGSLRGMTSVDRATWDRAQDEAEAGLLDPHAFATMLFGKLPLPPGAQPIRCRNSISRIWFTMGVDVPSAEYAQRLAEYERDGRKAVFGKVDFGTNHAYYSEKATVKMRAEIGRHYAAMGWQKVPGRTSREVYVPAGAAERSIKVGVWPDSYTEQLLCDFHGVKLPTGPVLEVSFPPPPG